MIVCNVCLRYITKIKKTKQKTVQKNIYALRFYICVCITCPRLISPFGKLRKKTNKHKLPVKIAISC